MFQRKCHHHDFLDSEVRAYWEELRKSDEFKDIVKVIYPNEAANSLRVGEWRELGELLGIDEAAEAHKLNRSKNRKKTLDAAQWTQVIKDWKQRWDVGYKNIDDENLAEDRIDEVSRSY